MKASFPSHQLAIAIGLWLAVGISAPALAQAPGSTGPTPTSNPTPVPLDGGASLLLASGVALGLKKLRDRKKKRS